MQTTATSRVVRRLLVYYVLLIGGGALVWRFLPHAGEFAPASLDTLFGRGSTATRAANVQQLASDVQQLDDLTLAITVAVAMLAAVLLVLPVAWVYLLTRAKRGYQQSVVQMLIILPLVVSGIVLLVKYSLALAFSLAGIVAAVQFRNRLDDSKDAVYVFLAIAIGLAAAVNLPVALVISIGFNIAVLLLWYTDFGSAPVELDGRIAEKRLNRARQLARTGTFVAKMDDEVFQNMTKEQLEGVAQRAWRRASSIEGDEPQAVAEETRVTLRTTNEAELRRLVEPKLQDYTKSWRLGAVVVESDIVALQYHVVLKKRTPPDELISLLRAAASGVLVDARLV